MFRRGLRKGRSMKGKRQAARSKNFKGGRKCRKGRSGTKKRRFENRKRKGRFGKRKQKERAGVQRRKVRCNTKRNRGKEKDDKQKKRARLVRLYLQADFNTNNVVIRGLIRPKVHFEGPKMAVLHQTENLFLETSSKIA